MTKEIVLLLILVISSFAAMGSEDIPNKKDFSFINLHIDDKASSTAQQMIAEIDRATLSAVAALPSPFVSAQMTGVEKVILSSGLTTTESDLTDVVTGITGPATNGIAAFVDILKKDDGGIKLTVFVSDMFQKTPLFYRIVALHETIGHLSQFLEVYSKYGPQRAYELLNDSNFVEEFFKISHIHAALTELQIYRAVPLQMLMDEINASDWSEGTKERIIERYKRMYSMPPQELIKYKSRLEACKPEAPMCITDEEYEVYFEHLRSLGFDYL